MVRLLRGFALLTDVCAVAGEVTRETGWDTPGTGSGALRSGGRPLSG